MAQATGPLADAIERDLFNAGRTLDELGWRGLWAYITKAPPGTAIHYDLTEGRSLSEEFTMETLNEVRELNWRYTAIHFKGGKDEPFPRRITRELLTADAPQVPKTWETVTLDELVSPEVRALLQS